jgi:signal transduction histidine kinase
VPLVAGDERLPEIATLYRFNPGWRPFEWRFEEASPLSVAQPIRRAGSGELLGYLIVSGGPRYSQGILSGVATAWAAAGLVAVGVAAGAGWLASWRMSRPLAGLTKVTTKMAGGDLSVRADARRKDEFGKLALSFNEMADRLQAFILTLQRFVADAAHELNTPLTALRHSLDLAMEEEDGAERALLIKQARHEVGRLEELARGLLDLSRLESGEQKQAPGPVDLVRLVREMSEHYASQAEQAALTFELELPARGKGAVVTHGDRAQLGRALANLLDNAVKFTPAGGRIEVGVFGDGREAGIWVEDSGIGIPEKDLPALFNRFHRGRNAGAYPGSGLGLAIVRAIVLQHGGSVVAENTNDGARFTMRLPAETA